MNSEDALYARIHADLTANPMSSPDDIGARLRQTKKAVNGLISKRSPHFTHVKAANGYTKLYSLAVGAQAPAALPPAPAAAAAAPAAPAPPIPAAVALAAGPAPAAPAPPIPAAVALAAGPAPAAPTPPIPAAVALAAVAPAAGPAHVPAAARAMVDELVRRSLEPLRDLRMVLATIHGKGNIVTEGELLLFGYSIIVVPFERPSTLQRAAGPGVDPAYAQAIRERAQEIIDEGMRGVDIPHYHYTLRPPYDLGVRGLRNSFAHAECFIHHGSRTITVTNHDHGAKQFEAACTISEMLEYLWSIFVRLEALAE